MTVGESRSPAGPVDINGLIALALDGLPDSSVIVFDRDLRLVLVRGGALAAGGYRPDELEGRLAAEALAPARWDFYRPMYESALRGESSAAEVASPDGLRRYSVRVSPVTDASDHILGGVALAADITDQGRNAQALRVAEHRYRLAVFSSGVGTALVDAEGRFEEVNEALCTMLGYTRDEIVGKPFIAFTHLDEVSDQPVGFLELKAGTSTVHQGRHRFSRADGAVAWTDVTASARRDEEGGFLGAIVQFVDVTAEVEQFAALVDSERRYRMLVDNSADVIFQQVEGKITWISPAVQSLIGWSAAELAGQSTIDLWHPDDRDAAVALRAAVYGGDVGHAVLRIRCKDGNYTWVEASLRPAPVGDRAGMVGTLRDVSARVEAETALRKAEERYRLVAENASDVVLLVSPDDAFTWVSPSSQAVLGWDPDEMVGHRGVEFVHPDDLARMQEVLSRARSGESPVEEYRVRRGDGHFIWVSVRTTPIPGPEGRPVARVAALRDVDETVQTRLRLEASHERLRDILDSLPDPHVLLDPLRDDEGRIIDFLYTEANPAACEFNLQSRDDLLGTRLFHLHPNVEPSGLFARYVHVIETGEPLILNDWAYEQEVLGGVVRRYDVHAVRVGDSISQGWRDVTERYEAAQDLADAERRYRMLAENTMDLVVSVDARRRVTWVSSSVTRRLGYLPEELVGKDEYSLLIHPDDRATLEEAAAQARLGASTVCRIRMLDKSGAEHWVEVAPRSLIDESGHVMGEVVGIRDIHEVIQAQQALAHEVDFDALTGLAKRSIALTWIGDILRTRRSASWALLCVGVDGMTAINQGYTYAVGDEVLRAVADRLVEAAGARDRVARIAGDEFVVLLRDIETPTDAANAAERMATAVRGPVSVADVRIDVTVCVGVALADGEDAEGLVRDATTAMRQVAAKGRDRWAFLETAIGEQTRQELAVQLSLREALDQGEVRPWLMPVADIRDGTIVGYEALARWVHDDGEVTSPDLFLGIAERTGLILALDRAMLAGVLEAMATLPPALHVAVNVSAATLASGTFDEWVLRELDRTHTDPARLHLEVTETALFQISETVTATMQSLATAGISWWVDDFGTGFSSISHLRDLPIYGLKLDQSFSRGVTTVGSRHAHLSQGLAGLARGLGLRTIAEGVETTEQARVLARHGWEMGQGWLYGKAEPPTTLA